MVLEADLVPAGTTLVTSDLNCRVKIQQTNCFSNNLQRLS